MEGKSFGTLKFCIDRFIKHKEEFIYLRRYEKELDDSKPTLFHALKKENKFPENILEVKGTVYIVMEMYGYTLAIYQYEEKSIPYSFVKWIIFEEFM